MELIGVLRRSVEIGRVDILYETSIMSTHLALPRVGHLEHLFHIFGYLKENPKRKIAFDPDHPFIDEQRLIHTTSMTSTTMQRRQFRGTCLHLEETVLPRIALKMRTLPATQLTEGVR